MPDTKKTETPSNGWWSDFFAKLVSAFKAWWEADKAKIIDFAKALLKDLWEAIKEAFKKLLERK